MTGRKRRRNEEHEAMLGPVRQLLAEAVSKETEIRSVYVLYSELMPEATFNILMSGINIVLLCCVGGDEVVVVSLLPDLVSMKPQTRMEELTRIKRSQGQFRTKISMPNVCLQLQS